MFLSLGTVAGNLALTLRGPRRRVSSRAASVARKWDASSFVPLTVPRSALHRQRAGCGTLMLEVRMRRYVGNREEFPPCLVWPSWWRVTQGGGEPHLQARRMPVRSAYAQAKNSASSPVRCRARLPSDRSRPGPLSDPKAYLRNLPSPRSLP